MDKQFHAAMGIGALLQMRREALRDRLRRDTAEPGTWRGKAIPTATDKSRRVVVQSVRSSAAGD